MKKYKLIYEKAGNFYGSETGIPSADDHQFAITRQELENYGLVYSVDGVVYYSTDKLPHNADDVAATAVENPPKKTRSSGKKSAAPATEPVVEPVVEPAVEPAVEPVVEESTEQVVAE